MVSSNGCKKLLKKKFEKVEIAFCFVVMTYELHSLLRKVGIEFSSSLKNLRVENISADSRLIKKGDLFVGLPGEKVDGGCFWREAMSAGAVASIISPQAAESVPPGHADAVIIVSDSLAYWMGELASVFWDQPSLKLNLIGVTGTNGKTTTTHLIEHLSLKCGVKSALFGTLYNRWPKHTQIAIHTTAFGDALQRDLAQAVTSGAHLGVMEVSSHALDQQRVAGCHFSGAVFTNLTHDHLDYHHSLDAYFEAKAKLFKFPYLNKHETRIVVNIDGTWGYKLSEHLKGRCWRASLDQNLIKSLHPELFLTDVKITSSGSTGVFHSPVGTGKFSSPLIGRFNLMNLLEAVGILLLHDQPLKALLSSIKSFPGVPGRMERINIQGNLPLVLVDYAHTPDGLKNALLALRTLSKGKLFCVFGCGGDRDRNKRSEMGLIASRLADVVIITSDNPRTEDPQRIIDDIAFDIPNKNEVIMEVDRATAIQKAILKALPGDMVLIAGKGHEDYQILREKTIEFDDREIAKDVLCSRLSNGC